MIPQEPHAVEATSGCFRVGEWLIEPALDEISRGTEIVKLEPRTMRLLCRLVEARGHVVSSQQLLDSVWAGVVVGPASVYQAISSLRKILGDSEATPTYIATVQRKGYRLIADVEDAVHVTPKAQAPAEPEPVSPTVRLRSLRSRLAVGALASLAIIVAVILAIAPRKEPASSASAPASASSPAAELPSIAVVPFETAAPDDSSALFAACMTDLLHNRLATQKSLLVVSVASARALRDASLDLRDVDRRLQARYELRGKVSRSVDQLRVRATLVDTSSGRGVWSKSYVRTPQEVTALREAIVAQVGAQLNVAIGSVGNAPVDLAAYEILMRGEQALAKTNKEGYSAAKAIFQRATELYPEFARAYLGLAQSLHLLTFTLTDAAYDKDERVLLIKSLDRALALDPQLGEAMIERAQYIEDPVKAEQMYRRGLELMPSYAVGAYKYSLFLWGQGRSGEAIDATNRGLRVDPLSAELIWTKANILAYGRGDISGHDRALRELLAIRPNYPLAVVGLGWSSYALQGKTADGIALFERQIARDSASRFARRAAAAAYLDVDDPAAAFSAANGLSFPLLEIAQYRREAHPVGLIQADLQAWALESCTEMSVCPLGEALRDEAMATGNYALALALFEQIRSDYKGTRIELRDVDLLYAHSLILSGDTKRGRELAMSLLQLFDAEEVGRPRNWFARDRASIYAMLGDDERAVSELAESVRRKDFARWWYTAELDPLFAHLRKDPRFQALAAEVKQHRAQQRVLLEEMRRKGEVPKRP